MHYLYRITNILSGKVYIGQSSDDKYRWRQHLYFAKNPERTGRYIHRAMAKHGSENFMFEVIVTCRTPEDANIIEDVLIRQFDSRNKEHGYNLNAGGFNGEHSEETKEKIRQATINQIATKGHPAKGRVVTQKTRDLMRKIRLENPVDYTLEKRQHMSEAHIGHKDSDEIKQKKSLSAKRAWEKRKAAK